MSTLYSKQYVVYSMMGPRGGVFNSGFHAALHCGCNRQVQLHQITTCLTLFQHSVFNLNVIMKWANF